MRILVVEDDHRIAASLKKGLELEGFAVDVAYTGTDGYDLASTEDYDTIVLDLMLPGMDGLNICQQLRKNHIHTPILILTARSQTENKIEGLNFGADDYLTKPFSFDELLARIRALMRRPKTEVSTVLSLNGLELNPQNFEVKRLKTNISLSRKEFSLLEFLLRHPHKVLTKEQIIAHVWDYDTDILFNTVEVYIRNLRRKIDIPFKKLPPLIQTIRGFGYKLG